MQEIDFKKLKGQYGRLIGLKKSFPTTWSQAKAEISDDYNKIVDSLAQILSEDLSDFKINKSCYFDHYGKMHFDENIGISKLDQILSYLENTYSVNENVKVFSSLINSIKDKDLQARCLDLLSLNDNFDRVINQATQILEDRIKSKSGNSTDIGVTLVNKVLNADLTKTTLIMSNNPDEHEGYCHMIRGIMLSFRNTTHHSFEVKYTQEEAMKVCEFVDLILLKLEVAKLKN